MTRLWSTYCSLATLSAAFMASPARAQGQASDSARCAAALNAPTADSAIVEEDALIFPFDATKKLPDSYADLLGQGLRQMLVLPRPLVVDTYDDRAGYAKSDAGSKLYATPVLRSFYRLTLHRDGHLTSVRAVGGARNEQFDRAVVAALVALDTSSVLPVPVGLDDSFESDTLELRRGEMALLSARGRRLQGVIADANAIHVWFESLTASQCRTASWIWTSAVPGCCL